MLKKVKAGVLVLMVILVSSLNASGAKFVVNDINLKMLKVPHVYEYNSLNPEKYWWCGHAAFSSAIKSVGVNKNLQDIHEMFIAVDYNSGTRIYNKNDKYAASMIHLQLASKEYGVRYLKTYLSNKNDFWNKIISSTKSKKPTIVLSKSYYSYKNKKWYNTGHYFVVIGYYIDKNNTKFVIIRDPFKKDGGKYFDKVYKLDYFWTHIKSSKKLPTLTVIK